MKTCRHCESSFSPNKRLGPNRMALVEFCSSACAAAARRKLNPIPCKQCRENFTPDNAKRIFCSRSCSSAAHKGKRSVVGKPARYKKTNGKLEHRTVMEGVIGRALVRGETVHHKNGLKQDNRPDNLELWFTPQPGGQRIPDLIDYLVTHHAKAVQDRLQLALSSFFNEPSAGSDKT